MDFPASLPAPQRSGYGISPVSRIGRTRFELGGLRPRRTSNDAPWRVSVRWLFTEAQLAVFDDWYANDITWGADAFNIDLANGLGLSSVSARFMAAPDTAHAGNARWEVTATLQAESLPVMTAAALAVASTYYPADIQAATGPLHTLIHTTLPNPYWVTP